ncbi:Tyrosine-protein kinase ABL2 [Taenia solium]|eukprot:TsM_000662000 transcript=TsM_000662000 gene=TsM_000662000
MDRAEATQLLTGCENGTFLVRISKNVSRMGEYSLSVVYHHPRHIRIQRSSDSCFYLCSPQRFKSLEARVQRRGGTGDLALHFILPVCVSLPSIWKEPAKEPLFGHCRLGDLS